MWISDQFPEPKKLVEELRDPNPDHQKSSSQIIVEEADGSIFWVIEVKQLGAILMRATLDEDGKLVFKGISEFTAEQIHTGRL